MNNGVKDITLIFSLSLNFGFLIAGAGYYLFASGRPANPAVAVAAGNAATAPGGAPRPAAAAAPVEISTEGHPSRGPADAPVTIVEFSDSECPFCGRVTPALKQIEDAYAGKVRRVFRQFPLLAIHPRAQKAAEASLCAGDQGRFWQMHDRLFEQPLALELADLYRKAEQAGLDVNTFTSCVESAK